MAIVGLCIYDYLLTFPQEIQYIWQRKLSIASLLYILTRYVGIVGQVAQTMPLVRKGQHSDTVDKVCAFMTFLLRTHLKCSIYSC
jgi:hypothetical protein